MRLSRTCVLSGFLLSLVLAGCSGGLDTTNIAGARLSGSVHGGQQAISGSSVTLWSVGTTGYGSLPTQLYSTVTNSSGEFSFPIGSWSANCTATGTNSSIPLYITSTGGDAGAGGNSSIALVAALGSCNSITTSTWVNVNEVTTVAAAYALAQFTRNDNIGAYAAGVNEPAGIFNAFATANNLVSLNTGLALSTTPAGNGTVPGGEISSLANILASCVNTIGGSGACTTLFTAATPSGGSTPTDTWQAAVDIVLNPSHNVGTLFGLSVANAPFQSPLPLTTTPNDWTVEVTYTGGGLQGDQSIAVDSSGNVWATNQSVNTLSEFSPTGMAISTSSGYTGGGLNNPFLIEFDASGNAWVTNNSSANSLSKFSSTGSAVTTSSGYTGGGLNGPIGIAMDGSGNVWVTNVSGNSLSEFSSSTGAAISPITTGYTGGGLHSPNGVAIDGSGNVWAANNAGNSLSKFSSTGSPISPVTTGYTGGGLNAPVLPAIDSSGNVWVANNSGNSLSKFSSTGTAISGSSGYTGGGLNEPGAIAIDGAGNVWAANNAGNNRISEFSSSGTAISGAAGYQGGGPSKLQSIAIDASGNVWAGNDTQTNGASTITEFVGAAVPVIAPIVGGLAGNTTLNGSSNLGTEPGPTYQVSGQINTNTGCSFAGVNGVTVSINTIPVQTTVTDSNGNFSFASVPNGTYTLTPSIVGPSSAFYPATQNLTVSNGATFTNFTATLGYTVSGTVLYGGSQTGRTYVSLVQSSCSGGGTVGTSIVTKGTYTIQGVAPGTYTLNAFMDNIGYGAENAEDPAGAGSTNGVGVSTGNVTGANVTLTNPGVVTLSSAPNLRRIDPLNSGAVVQYAGVQSNGVEQATGYTLQWSTTSTFDVIVDSETFPAIGTHDGPAFTKPLTDGSVYYFRMFAISAGSPTITASTTSSTIGPIKIGQLTSGNSVSGAVTFTGAATGPLYVGIYDQNSNAVYGQYIANPVSAQTFTINVPNGSNYALFAVVDQNGDGVVDAGDINNVDNGSNPSPLPAITGTTTGESLTLPSAGAGVVATTQNYISTVGSNSSQNYSLYFQISSLVKQPEAVTLTGGPNVIGPVDIAVCGNGNTGCGTGFQYGFNIGSTVPSVGDSYGFNITYTDGTTGTLTATVTAVLNVFATGLAPVTGGSVSTTPTFSWIDPVCGACSGYNYSFTLNQNNGGTIWQIPGNNANSNGFSNSITAIPWNTDPSGNNSLPSVGSLSTSLGYSWSIQITDSNNNSTVQQVQYQP